MNANELPCPHEPVDRDPVIVGDAVNVDRVCRVCGAWLATVSYAREEWDRRMAELDAQPDLPGLDPR